MAANLDDMYSRIYHQDKIISQISNDVSKLKEAVKNSSLSEKERVKTQTVKNNFSEFINDLAQKCSDLSEKAKTSFENVRKAFVLDCRIAAETVKDLTILAQQKAFKFSHTRDVLVTHQKVLNKQIEFYDTCIEKIENFVTNTQNAKGHLRNAIRSLRGKPAETIENTEMGMFSKTLIKHLNDSRNTIEVAKDKTSKLIIQADKKITLAHRSIDFVIENSVRKAKHIHAEKEATRVKTNPKEYDRAI